MRSSDHNFDIKFMRLAIDLAKKGQGFVSPNPLVGAVLVLAGKVIATGFHGYFGDRHAEAKLLEDFLANGGVITGQEILYVTLEPCCHYGKRPPCVDAILASGVKNVIVGSLDVNPLVSGKGIEILRQNGVRVELILDFQEELAELNRVFVHWITTGLPYFVGKMSMNCFGQIAESANVRTAISGNEFSEFVRSELRPSLSAILIGKNTLLTDNPNLGAKDGLYQPLRVCLGDPGLDELQRQDYAFFRDQNFLIVEDSGENFAKLIELLVERNVASVLVEGGSLVMANMLKSGLLAELMIALNADAPYFPNGLMGFADLPIAIRKQKDKLKIERLGQDTVITWRLKS
jgi:diaminohydroxyphosphoribosylaminopyrimidine deaminase/5-amino-6-(5-phosphoribosylamino)uracil reductase